MLEGEAVGDPIPSHPSHSAGHGQHVRALGHPLSPPSQSHLPENLGAAAAAERQAEAGGVDEGEVSLVDQYLDENSRLACQLVLRKEDEGLELTLPDDVLNMLEVPLWLRGSR